MSTVRGGEGWWEVGRDAGVGRGRERAGVPVLPPAFGQRGPAGRRRHRQGGCESSGGGERAERGADGEAQEWGAGRRNRRETRGGWGRFEGEARVGGTVERRADGTGMLRGDRDAGRRSGWETREGGRTSGKRVRTIESVKRKKKSSLESF